MINTDRFISYPQAAKEHVSFSWYWKQVELATTDIVAWVLLSAVAWGCALTGYVPWSPYRVPISGYMLARFIKWEEGYDYYDTDHWIAKEVMETSWYRNRKDYFLKWWMSKLVF